MMQTNLIFEEGDFIEALPYINRLKEFSKTFGKDIVFTSKAHEQVLTGYTEIVVTFRQPGDDLFQCLPLINKMVEFCQAMVIEIGKAGDLPAIAAIPSVPPAPPAPSTAEPPVEEKEEEKPEEKLIEEVSKDVRPSERPMKEAAYSSLRSKYTISIEQAAFLRDQPCQIQDVYKVFREKYPDSIKSSEDIEGFYRGVLLRRGLLAVKEGGKWETSEIKTKGATAGGAPEAPPGPPGARQDPGQPDTRVPAREGQDTMGTGFKRGDIVRVKIDENISISEGKGMAPRPGSTYKGKVKNVRPGEVLVRIPLGDIWVRPENLEKGD